MTYYVRTQAGRLVCKTTNPLKARTVYLAGKARRVWFVGGPNVRFAWQTAFGS